MSFVYWEDNYRRYTAPDAGDGWLRAYARELLPGSDVLDLGCGLGSNIPDLLQMGVRISAADFSKKAIAALQDRFEDALERMDCFDMREALPYEDGSFDAVVADLSLHYFSWTNTQSVLGEIHRVLKVGGCLIARVHSLESLPELPGTSIEEHYYLVDGCARRYFTEDEIRRLLSAWEIHKLQQKQIHRYQRTKHVIEFKAVKN